MLALYSDKFMLSDDGWWDSEMNMAIHNCTESQGDSAGMKIQKTDHQNGHLAFANS